MRSEVLPSGPTARTYEHPRLAAIVVAAATALPVPKLGATCPPGSAPGARTVMRLPEAPTASRRDASRVKECPRCRVRVLLAPTNLVRSDYLTFLPPVPVRGSACTLAWVGANQRGECLPKANLLAMSSKDPIPI
jgi:hypothetical protein